MSDDVKVKFSGDFTEISKGAKEAATKAGTALQSQFAQLGNSLAGTLGGYFAFTSIFDTLKEKMGEAKEYFSELNRAIRTTGASGDEFQRVASLGKSVGVPLETVGRSMGLFSKYIGAASKDAKGHGKVLIDELKFSQDEVTSGNISATEVLARLSKQLKETGNESLAAANATVIFGRSGRELLPIIQKGEGAIREQSNSIKVYSEAELQAAEASERAAERRMAAWKKFFRFLELSMDENKVATIVGDQMETVANQMQAKGINIQSGEGAKQYNAELIKSLQALGVGLSAQQAGARQYMQQQLATPGLPASVRADIMAQFAELTAAMVEADKKAKESPDSGPAATAGGVATLVTSSLQSIGGGDIGAIMSGYHVDIAQEQLDVQKQIAQNTTPAAPGSDKTITPVAK